MTTGDRVVVLHQRPGSEFVGWATVHSEKHVMGDKFTYVIFDHIPPNNRYGYNANVFALYVIEEEPCLSVTP